MPAILIDGKAIAKEIRQEVKDKVKGVAVVPGIAFLLIGKDPASEIYVGMKEKGCREVGFYSTVLRLSEDVNQKTLLQAIENFNADPRIHGILVQQPLPKHIATQAVVEAIDPTKDVDGFHPLNLGRLVQERDDGFIPCTPLGILTLLEKTGVAVEGKRVLILGRSLIVGKPLALLLSQKKVGRNATVTLAHSGTQNLKALCREADLLIAAIGRPRFVMVEMVKPGAVVIDVGINRTPQGLVGDVDFEKVREVVSAITPVPGGVGPMTIAMLLKNTYRSYTQMHSKVGF